MKPKSFCKHLVVTVLLVRYGNSWRVYIWQLGRLCSSCVPELLLVFIWHTHYPSWWWVGQNWKVVWCPCCDHMPTNTCGEIWRASFTCKASAHGVFYLHRHNSVTHMPSTLYLWRNSWHREVQLAFGLIESKICAWHSIVFTVYFSVKCRQSSTTSILITNFLCCLRSSIYMFQFNNPSSLYKINNEEIKIEPHKQKWHWIITRDLPFGVIIVTQ
jgi:hypothetical protein